MHKKKNIDKMTSYFIYDVTSLSSKRLYSRNEMRLFFHLYRILILTNNRTRIKNLYLVMHLIVFLYIFYECEIVNKAKTFLTVKFPFISKSETYIQAQIKKSVKISGGEFTHPGIIKHTPEKVAKKYSGAKK